MTSRLLLLVVMIGYVPAVLSHAVLVKSDPPKRASLAKAPPQLRLWFNERLEPAYANATVYDAGGKPVTQQQASVASDDAKLLTLPLPPLKAGAYRVEFRVLSIDGHRIKSNYSFSIRAPATPVQ